LIEIVVDGKFYLFVFGLTANKLQFPIVKEILIIVKEVNEGRVLQHYLLDRQFPSDGGLLKSSVRDQSLLLQPTVVDQGVLRGLTKDVVLEMVGEEVNVGIAEIGDVVEGVMAEDDCLAFPFGLHRQSGNQINGDGFVFQNDTGVDAVVHIGCDSLQKIADSYLFVLLVYIFKGFLGEDDVVVVLLLLALLEASGVVGLAGAPLLHGEIVDEQYFFLGLQAVYFPKAGGVVFS
jgi:hypothetical protein